MHTDRDRTRYTIEPNTAAPLQNSPKTTRSGKKLTTRERKKKQSCNNRAARAGRPKEMNYLLRGSSLLLRDKTRFYIFFSAGLITVVKKMYLFINNKKHCVSYVRQTDLLCPEDVFIRGTANVEAFFSQTISFIMTSPVNVSARW